MPQKLPTRQRGQKKQEFTDLLRQHLGSEVRQLLAQVENISPGLIASTEVTQSLIQVLEAAGSIVSIMGAATPSAKKIQEARFALVRAYESLLSLSRKLGLD